jgi:peptide chain release factor subunit 1
MSGNDTSSQNQPQQQSGLGKLTNKQIEEQKTDDEKKRYKLKKLLSELEAIRGRHTELVSVYIPSGYSIVDVINQLKDEQGTASNIKSKTTRKNVVTALEKIIQHLKIFKETPPNGVAAFAGNVSEIEGKEDIKIWSFEPAERLPTKIYWCDQTFVLEPLKEMVKEKDLYGIIVLDAREANIGLLSGKKVQSLKHLDSTVPSKTVKGGMSQGRYDRLREDAINEFLNEIGDSANEILLKYDLKGLIIGGPGPVKEHFAKGKYLNYMIANKLLGVKDTGYTGDYGLRELVERSEDLLKESSVAKERAIVKRFFAELEKNGPVTYGVKEVKEAIDSGAVDTLLLSEGFDWVRVVFECQCNAYKEERDMPKRHLDEGRVFKCPKCDGNMKPKEGEITELLDIFIDKAEKIGAKVEMISLETPEGSQFKELGGIAAMLRYKIG